jgi:hypothetical protein
VKVTTSLLRGDPVFFAVWHADGKFHKKLFRFPLDADAQARAEIGAQALEHAQSRDSRIHPDQTFAGYLHYYADHLPSIMSAAGKANVRPAIKLCAGLVPDVKLAALRSDQISELYLAMLKANSKKPKAERLSPRTVQNHLGFVQQSLSCAVDEGRLTANPFKAYYANPSNKLKRVAHPLDPVATLQYPDIEAGLDGPYLVYLRLHMHAGLSGPEAIALTWDKVHLDHASIDVHQTFRTRGKVGLCALNRHRSVTGIDPQFMAFLSEVKTGTAVYDNPYVINAISAYGKPLGRPRLISLCNQAIRTAQQAAGIKSLRTKKPYAGKSFRDRHTVDRLNDPKRNFQITQDQAGSSSAPAFVARFGAAYRPRDAGEQIAQLMIGMERLRGHTAP